MTVTNEDRLAAGRCVAALTAGVEPAPADVRVTGFILARDEGCRCPVEVLTFEIRAPYPDGDPRPVLFSDGHVAGCPVIGGPGRPPGLRLVA